MESHLTSDLKKIDHIIEGKATRYDWPVDVTPRFIEQNGYFNASRSFIKGLLCLMASHKPQSFDSGNSMRLRNDWLQRANSKNYHHFFPRAYMAKNTSVAGFRVNHIANITFVDDYLNKRIIRANPPSVYLGKFQSEGPAGSLATALKSHLIDLENDGVLNDDFDTFFRRRIEALSAALQKQVIAQEIDGKDTVLPEEEVEAVENDEVD